MLSFHQAKEPPTYLPYPDIVDEFTHKRDVKRIKVKHHNDEYEAKLNAAKREGFTLSGGIFGDIGHFVPVDDDGYKN